MRPALRLVLSEVDSAGCPTAADAPEAAARARQHPSCDPAIAVELAIAAAEHAVIETCRAETDAERYTQGTYRHAMHARRDSQAVKEHDAALNALAKARDARRAAVAELEHIENTQADDR